MLEERRRLGKFAYTGDQAWVMVRARRNQASIRGALLKGDFYSTTGVLLREIRTSESAFRLVIEADSEGAASYRTRFVGKGGRTLANLEGTSPRYVFRGDEGYVRAVVEGPGKEKAWLQPYFLSRQ